MNITKTIAIAITSFLFVPVALAGSPEGAPYEAVEHHRLGAPDAHHYNMAPAPRGVRVRDHRMPPAPRVERQAPAPRVAHKKKKRLKKKRKIAITRYKKLLRSYDFNRDGVLSWGEINSRPRFGAPDTNSPIAKKRRKDLRRVFRKADWNRDHIVTRKEFVRAALRPAHEKNKRAPRYVMN